MKHIKTGRQTYKHNQMFDVMGTDVQNNIVLKIKPTQVFVSLRPENMAWRRLLSIGDDNFWAEIVDLDRLQAGHKRPLHPKMFIDDICNALFILARKRGLFKVSATRGYGAWREGNDFVFNLGDRLLVNGRSMPLDNKQTVENYVGGVALPYQDEFATDDQMSEWAESLKDCAFESPHAGRCFVGWLVVAILGGALDWRPHLWLIGPSASGKSWLLENVAKRLLGEYLCITNNVSEAGLSRKLGNATMPVCIDEAEAETVEQIFIAMRNSATGFGSRLRASPGNGVTTDEFVLRSCFLASSITVPNMTQRDASRTVFVRLKRDDNPEEWPATESAITASLAGGTARRIRNRIIYDMQAVVVGAQKIKRNLMRSGLSARVANQYGAILSGYGYVTGADQGFVREEWVDGISAEIEFTQATLDFDTAMELLLQTKIDIGNKGEKKSILQIYFPIATDPDYETVLTDDIERLMWMGIKLTADKHLRIAYNHPDLKRAFQKTKIGHVNLREVLIQGGNAVTFPGRKRFGKAILYCAEVKLTSLDLFRAIF